MDTELELAGRRYANALRAYNEAAGMEGEMDRALERAVSARQAARRTYEEARKNLEEVASRA